MSIPRYGLPLLLLLACERERVEPATPGSPAAQAVVLAAEIEELTKTIEAHARDIQAAGDPEAVEGGVVPDLERIRGEMEALRAEREEVAEKLEAMEALARGE